MLRHATQHVTLRAPMLTLLAFFRWPPPSLMRYYAALDAATILMLLFRFCYDFAEACRRAAFRGAHAAYTLRAAKRVTLPDYSYDIRITTAYHTRCYARDAPCRAAAMIFSPRIPRVCHAARYTAAMSPPRLRCYEGAPIDDELPISRGHFRHAFSPLIRRATIRADHHADGDQQCHTLLSP